MTTVPGRSSGARTSRIYAAKASPSIHCPAVHVYMHERGPFDHPRRDQAIMGQARNERLCAPCAERGVHFQAIATQAAPSQAGQVGFNRSFVHCPTVHCVAMSPEGMNTSRSGCACILRMRYSNHSCRRCFTRARSRSVATSAFVGKTIHWIVF